MNSFIEAAQLAKTAALGYVEEPMTKVAAEDLALAKQAAIELYNDALEKIAYAEQLYAEADAIEKYAADNGPGTPVPGQHVVMPGQDPVAAAQVPGNGASALNAFLEQARKARAALTAQFMGNNPQTVPVHKVANTAWSMNQDFAPAFANEGMLRQMYNSAAARGSAIAAGVKGAYGRGASVAGDMATNAAAKARGAYAQGAEMAGNVYGRGSALAADAAAKARGAYAQGAEMAGNAYAGAKGAVGAGIGHTLMSDNKAIRYGTRGVGAVGLGLGLGYAGKQLYDAQQAYSDNMVDQLNQHYSNN